MSDPTDDGIAAACARILGRALDEIGVTAHRPVESPTSDDYERFVMGDLWERRGMAALLDGEPGEA